MSRVLVILEGCNAWSLIEMKVSWETKGFLVEIMVLRRCIWRDMGELLYFSEGCELDCHGQS